MITDLQLTHAAFDMWLASEGEDNRADIEKLKRYLPIVLDECVYVPISSLGKCFDLYAYQPAQIDRETWESCPCCDAAKANSGVVNQALWVKEPEVNKWTLFGKKLEYCPICGRPLTPEAWAELEKRLRG